MEDRSLVCIPVVALQVSLALYDTILLSSCPSVLLLLIFFVIGILHLRRDFLLRNAHMFLFGCLCVSG